MFRKKNNAITLIALVITIVIMLILAAVSIAAITHSGIFGKANEAKEQTMLAEKKEEEKRALSEVLIDCKRRNITSNS